MKKHYDSLIYFFLVTSIIALSSLSCQTSKVAKEIDVSELTISEIHTAFKNGSYNCQQLTAAYLDRINYLDSNINSIITINTRALEIAASLDEEYKGTKVLRPLHGIPLIVKDNIHTKGIATTAGSIALQHFIPNEDAFIIRLVRH